MVFGYSYLNNETAAFLDRMQVECSTAKEHLATSYKLQLMGKIELVMKWIR